jgi:FkbM family methyltransferase
MDRLEFKLKLLRWRRRLALRLGNKKYCQVGSWQLMEELFRGRPPGIFLEAGAHDGWTGSNTYWLEAALGWRGVLIEPVPELYQVCCKERIEARVFHGALVSSEFSRSTIDIECSGLVSAVTDSPMLIETREIARSYYGMTSRSTKTVPALTLNYCLEQAKLHQLDFISLDVEGFEGEALRGLNLEHWRPQWMLIECNDLADVIEAVGPYYKIERHIAPKDVLFERLD